MRGRIRPVSIAVSIAISSSARMARSSRARVHPLGPYPRRLTERLEHWARVAPDRLLVASAIAAGDWRARHLCARRCAKVRAIGAALLARGLCRPSGRSRSCRATASSIALLALGVPACRHSLRAGLDRVFADLHAISASCATSFGCRRRASCSPMTARNTPGRSLDRRRRCRDRLRRAPTSARWTLFDALLATDPGPASMRRRRAVGSGSHREIPVHLRLDRIAEGRDQHATACGAPTRQMMRAVVPVPRRGAAGLLDWTALEPHVRRQPRFRARADNGGTLYIDDGKPMPGGIEASVRNLREIAPTFYLQRAEGVRGAAAVSQARAGAAGDILLAA